MLKKNTILISTLFVFTVLNFAPYFMINCTEPDGNNHMENVFNRCCPSSMHGLIHQHLNDKKAAFSTSHCKCTVNFSSEEYILPHSDKILINQNLLNYSIELQDKFTEEENLFSYKSESPPISLHLIISAVLII